MILPSSTTRIRLLWLALLVSFTGDSPLYSQDASIVSPFEKDEVDKSVERAIQFLISKQHEDGSIHDKGADTAMTSLAIMAMASVGAQPNEPGPRGESMRKAIAYVLRDDRIDKEGYFGRADSSRMYGHGIITLMLTEMLGMGLDAGQDKLLQARCENGLDLILSSQRVKKNGDNQGGWRYEPDASDSDLSVSVWQLMALRSAKNDGLDVPIEAIDEAVEYLRRSYSAPLDTNGEPPDRPEGFCYTPGQRSASFTMTAAGLLALQVCGMYDSPLVKHAADWLLKNPPKYRERFFFYGTYYYAQGMFQRGGEHAETAVKLVKDELLPNQQGDGSWQGQNGEEENAGKIYATSLGVLSLSVKYHYLPIYQR